MLNDFTGGGQIFLHKIRMFLQVLNRSFTTSLIVTIVILSAISYKPAGQLDWSGAMTYQKALFADSLDDALSGIRTAVNPNSNSYTKIDAFDKRGLYARDIDPRKIIKSHLFKTAYFEVIDFIYIRLLIGLSIITGIFLLIFVMWSRFGRDVKEEKHISGATIKTAKEVARYLRSINKVSPLVIGDMPLVKDSETKHLLITGTTGSGKTNLIHNLLPQLIKTARPALIVDQTGEMIARYYNPDRGDIIFNPLDSRSHSWDFWADNASDTYSSNQSNSRLEKFAKVLFKYGKAPSGSDPFWDNSAEVIFVACVQYLLKKDMRSINELQNMLSVMNLEELSQKLENTNAARYLTKSNKTTASSILSVMATNTKPLNLLTQFGDQFSLKQYFDEVKAGSDSWLFLSSPPDLREVTMPLIACMFELSVSYLIGMGINHNRRMWFVIDELASLGRLNGFSTLMSESRKYGGCVLAATQSINQLIENFGIHTANHIFGQFATKFLFRSDDPTSAKIISNIFGELEYSHQQKNTSFGANEFRDGISYTEQQRHKTLITTDNLASLADHECFVGLPEPKIRIAKIKVPLAKKAQDIHSGFIMREHVISTKSIDEEITQATQQSQAATEDHQSKTSDKSDSTLTTSFKTLTQSLTENTDDEEPTSQQKLVTSLNSKLLWSKSSKDQKNIEDRGNLEELNTEDLEHEAQDQELTVTNNLK
jgi:type IV conjugative transfer system coupling protein TraD